jgi:hypothetical protein
VLFHDDGLAVARGQQVHFCGPGGPAAMLSLAGEVVALFRTPGAMVAAVRSAGGLGLLRLAAGKASFTSVPLGPALAVPGGATSVATSGAGEMVLVGCGDHTARLFRVRDGQALGRPWKHPRRVQAVAVSADGARALTGCDDRVVRLWSVPDGKLVREPRHHGAPVRAVAFSPGGEEMLSGGDDHRGGGDLDARRVAAAGAGAEAVVGPCWPAAVPVRAGESNPSPHPPPRRVTLGVPLPAPGCVLTACCCPAPVTCSLAPVAARRF